MKQLQLYALLGLLAFSVVSGGATILLWKRNAALSDELENVQIARDKAEANLMLVADQLSEERLTRQAAEDALLSIREVPDVDYNTPLPDSIRGVLSDFHNRVQQ